jgi:hypothetical protein
MVAPRAIEKERTMRSVLRVLSLGAFGFMLATAACHTVGAAGRSAGNAAGDAAEAAGSAAGTAARGAGDVIDDTTDAAQDELD